MENNIEEFEDALSLCDLPLHDHEIESNLISTDCDDLNSPPSLDFFEFSSSPNTNSAADNIIFCGKIISKKTDFDDNVDQRKNLVTRSTPSSPHRSKNFRCPSSGNSSKKQKVIIGLAKIPSKMELSDLRERQNRRTPRPMFPAVAESSESAVVSGKGSGGKSRNWGLLRPFRCKAQDLANMLGRSSSSLGCLRLARPCLD